MSFCEIVGIAIINSAYVVVAYWLSDARTKDDDSENK